MNRVLIYFDHESIQNSLELCGVVSRIYPQNNVRIDAINVSNLNDGLIGHVDTILNVKNNIDVYDYRNIAQLIMDVHNKNPYQCILFPSSKHGRVLAPRVAMGLHLGLVADITDVQMIDGRCEIIRPAYGGKIMASIECLKETLMVSVRENIFSLDHRTFETKIEQVEVKHLMLSRVKCVSKIEKNERVQDIRQSDILVSGGYGILKNFNRIYELADLLDGHVSASRKIVDEGLVSRKIQVGQSGKTVSPKLYIALGISGSTQHIEGLRNIETIISVNTNEFAPLNYISDVVVLGDAVEFTNRLIEKINKERKG